MGNCFSSSSADEVLGTPVVLTQAPLDSVLATMRTGAQEVSVMFLGYSCKAPSAELSKSLANTVTTVGGQYTACCVGITMRAALDDYDFLVSDSFSPCVPIVIFGSNNTWLAHSNGLGAAQDIITSKALFRDASFYIVSKKNCRQANIAQAIFKLFDAQDLCAEIIEVETTATIGVVVSGVAKSVLVYRQE